MKRRLRVVAVSFSAALAALTALVWLNVLLNGTWAVVFAPPTATDSRLMIFIDRTLAGLSYHRKLDVATLPNGWRSDGIRGGRFGFRYEWSEWGIAGGRGLKVAVRVRSIAVPVLVPVLLLALLPMRCMRGRWTSDRRRRLGLCAHCGYDMRATPQRCPECGGGGISAYVTPR